jgi:hypothetical protein
MARARIISAITAVACTVTPGIFDGQAKGHYIIRKVPPGVHQLVVHHVGYAMYTRSVDICDADSINIDVALVSAPIQGEQVEVVAPDAKKWRHLLKQFKREFIGTSKYAGGCEIVNPEVLDLYIDSDSKTLVATTDSVLHIENTALGYRIHVILVKFEYHDARGTMVYVVYPKFEDLLLDGRNGDGNWRSNRERCLDGSLRHFLTAVARGRLHEEGFRASLVSESGSRESIRMVSHQDLILQTPAEGTQLHFPGTLYVTSGMDRASWIELPEGAVAIDSLGNCHGPRLAITRYGYWTEQRLADCLPFDYQPDH